MNTLTPQAINDCVSRWIAEHSGYEPARDYLEMSKCGLCPRAWFHSYRAARPTPTESEFNNFRRGLLMESETKRALAESGILKRVPAYERTDANGFYFSGSEREVVAPFDPRLKGHTDGETVDGRLLELKSVRADKLAEVWDTGKAHPNHFRQVQIYMRYGRYREAVIHYIVPETFEHTSLIVPYFTNVASTLEAKAKAVLRAIDTGIAPRCECGRCGVNGK